jgi:Flp pilus assembly protein TadD
MLAEAGNYETAADEAQRLVARAPADAMAYTLLGIAYQAMNNAGAAEQAFASALQLNPADEDARRGLQQVQAR